MKISVNMQTILFSHHQFIKEVQTTISFYSPQPLGVYTMNQVVHDTVKNQNDSNCLIFIPNKPLIPIFMIVNVVSTMFNCPYIISVFLHSLSFVFQNSKQKYNSMPLHKNKPSEESQ